MHSFVRAFVRVGGKCVRACARAIALRGCMRAAFDHRVVPAHVGMRVRLVVNLAGDLLQHIFKCHDSHLHRTGHGSSVPSPGADVAGVSPRLLARRMGPGWDRRC